MKKNEGNLILKRNDLNLLNIIFYI